jgi:hypothetical protein
MNARPEPERWLDSKPLMSSRYLKETEGGMLGARANGWRRDWRREKPWYEGDDMNLAPLLSAFGRDLKYALRVLRRTPAFTTTAVVTLALAIGANTAVFSLVDAILIKPLPIRSRIASATS